MHCRQCGYPLWNLSQPRCPECGTPFDLRTYRFIPQTVAFACPHCHHLHGGIGNNHLPSNDPQALCLRCGQVMNVPSMSVVPLVENPQTIPTTLIPWEERKRLGLFSAWWQTTKLAMLKPSQLGQQLSPDSKLRDGYRFAAFTLLSGILINGGLLLLILAGSGWLMAGSLPLSQVVLFGLITLAVSISIIFLVPWWITLANALPTHFILWLSGKSRHKLKTTVLTYWYAMAAYSLFIIPLCGFILIGIGGIWMLISAILILKHSQKLSTAWAVFAVLLPSLFFYILQLFSGKTF